MRPPPPAEPHLDVRAQIERANAIQAYADSDDDDGGEAPFLPTHFKSSAKLKKKLADAASKKADPKTVRRIPCELLQTFYKSLWRIRELAQLKMQITRCLD